MVFLVSLCDRKIASPRRKYPIKTPFCDMTDFSLENDYSHFVATFEEFNSKM